MIIDKLSNISNYEGSSKNFKKVFDYIRSIELKTLPVGKHQMPDELGYISIDKIKARSKEGGYPEAHKKYIDIQIPFNVTEMMGWKSVSDCKTLRSPYSEEKDIVFYSDESDFYIPVKPGQFIIFFPGDAHTPLIGSDIIHKAVIKVRI